MSKEKMNEYELLYLARSNDEEAFQLLAQQYHPMFQKMISLLIRKEHGLTRQEALQAAHIGLYHAIFYYREDKKMAFHNFVWLCASREINGLIRRETTYLYSGDALKYSLSHTMNETEGLYLEDTIPSNSFNPETMAASHMLIEAVFGKYPENTTEGQVFKLKMMGYNYREIADQCHISASKASKILQKIKSEFRELFQHYSF